MTNPVNGFGITYGDEIIHCEARMAEHSYEIFFNGKWMASIEHTDSLNWIQASGVILPQSIIDEIGEKIERHYN